MGNITEIKEKLDKLYEEYRKNKSQLSNEKTKEATKLLFELTINKNSDISEIAAQLSRFSADVVNLYFDKITKGKSISIDLLDELLKEFYSTDKNAKLSQHYVQKYSSAITAIMKNYKDKALSSVQLPRLVSFIAQFAVKSERNRKKFQDLINSTMGGIFMLDYSNIKKNSLKNIWNATKAVYPDLSKAKYESLITEWGKKYGFIQNDAATVPDTSEKAIKTEESIVSKDIEAKSAKAAEKKAVSNTDEKNKAATTPSVAPEKESSSEITAQTLYVSLKRDMTKEQEAIITAFTDMITPIGKAFETIQGEINKSREIGTENVLLRAKTEDLERQLSEQRLKLQEVNQFLMSARTENNELKKKISSLESKNSELDSKLNDAYAINSRESSLEAEKIRSELKKSFAFLYEDWLEYEFSDASEDNYESLQAIIKKIFRSLERNGIDFKGNN